MKPPADTAPTVSPLLLTAQGPTFLPEDEKDRSDGARGGFTAWALGADAVAIGLSGTATPLTTAGVEQPSVQQWADIDFSQARDVFERDYPSGPEGAVAGLLWHVTRWEGAATFGVSPVQAAAVLLSQLPRAAYGRQNLLLDALKRFASPRDIVQGALTVSQTPSGPDVLQAAAGLLEHYASDAWSALEWLASLDRPECRYFVRQIAGCEGVDEPRRARALARLAQNPDSDTRWEVAETLESGLLANPSSVWRTLASAPEEGIHNLAADRLGALTD
jgi:hypothetical protein